MENTVGNSWSPATKSTTFSISRGIMWVAPARMITAGSVVWNNKLEREADGKIGKQTSEILGHEWCRELEG